jgi:hypothetical protein
MLDNILKLSFPTRNLDSFRLSSLLDPLGDFTMLVDSRDLWHMLEALLELGRVISGRDFTMRSLDDG